MMSNYFNESTLSNFLKIKKNLVIFLISLSVLFCVSFTLFIVFASFELKTLFSVLGSIVCTVLFCIILALFYKLHYVKDFLFRFSLIKDGESKKVDCKIINVSDVITLQNNDHVREITISKNKKIRILYLYDFVEDKFVLNEDISLLVVDDFIKGVIQNEN